MKCVLCGWQNSIFVFSSCNTHGRFFINQNEKFDLYKCLNCGSIFVGNILINDEFYKRYYDQTYYDENSYNKKTPVNMILAYLYKYSIGKKQKFILDFFKSKDKKLSVLDIGCGDGTFLFNLDNNRFKKTGIEINSKAEKICRKKGIQIYNQDITKIDFKDERYDIITMWHVLEHIDSPINIFNKIYKILSNNGILIFQVPNSDGLGFKFGKKYWFHLDSPRHLVLYNKKSIDFLCKKTGFKIVRIKNEFYDYPLDLFWSIRKSVFKFLIYPLYLISKIFSREHLTFFTKKL